MKKDHEFWASVIPPRHSAGDTCYPCYRTVEETYAAAASLDQLSELATWTGVGYLAKSLGPLDGYDMMVLKLTNNAIAAQPSFSLQLPFMHRVRTS